MAELERAGEESSSDEAVALFAATQERIEAESALVAADARVEALIIEVDIQVSARAEAERMARETAEALMATEARATALADQLADVRSRAAAADVLGPATEAHVEALGDPLFDAMADGAATDADEAAATEGETVVVPLTTPRPPSP